MKKISFLFLLAMIFQLVSINTASAAYVPVKGDLIKIAEASTVFLVDDIGQRIPLSAGAFQVRYNNNFGLVKSLTEQEVAGFTTYLIIQETQSHPSGSLVMYWNNPTVYLIENGFKRGFTTWESFVASGYDIGDVHAVGEYEIYPTGSPIK